MNQSITSNY